MNVRREAGARPLGGTHMHAARVILQPGSDLPIVCYPHVSSGEIALKRIGCASYPQVAINPR